MKKTLIKVGVIVLVLIGVIAGVAVASRLTGQKFAMTQAEYIRDGDIELLYEKFIPEVKNDYVDLEGFMESAAGGLITAPIDTVKQKGHSGNIMGGTYKFYLVQLEDNTQGYTLDVEITPGLWGRKIKNITVQPVSFLEAQ